MTKYSDKITRVIGRASNAATPFEALNCLITDEMLDDIAQHTSQYILTFHRNFRHESDAIFTDKTGIKAFIDLQCLAGALRSSTSSMEELWGTDGDGIKKTSRSDESESLQVPNQM